MPGRGRSSYLAYDFLEEHAALGGPFDHRSRGSVVINGIDFTVIGIAPESFTGLDVDLRPAFYIPIMMAERVGIFSATARAEGGRQSCRRSWGAGVRGSRGFRLKPGVTRGNKPKARLTTDLEELGSEVYPDTNRNQTVAVRTEPAKSAFDGGHQPPSSWR